MAKPKQNVSIKKPTVAKTEKTSTKKSVKTTTVAKPTKTAISKTATKVTKSDTKTVVKKPVAKKTTKTIVKQESSVKLTEYAHLSPYAKLFLLKAQKNEETEAIIYKKVASRVKDLQNKAVLERLSLEEKKHADIWRSITHIYVKPDKVKIFWYTFIARLFGFTFAMRLMENGEQNASQEYKKVAQEVPEAEQIASDEEKHESAILDILDEERLKYVGSMILGLSDALVELTGTLAGLTFALGNLRIVALSGLITGIAAALSMTSSSYLSEKADNNPKALKSSLYTGGVYLFTVILLILPYLLLPQHATLPAIFILGGIVILLIAAFMFYVAIAKNESFWKKFLEMAIISISVAVVSFAIGLIVKKCLGIDL